MTVRPILHWPDPILKRRADPVSGVDAEIQSIWTDMVDTMEAMPGVGLAAPQIGVSLRLCVVDASDERGKAIRMANPEIIEESEELSPYPEGSPCLPGVSAEIKRPAVVTVRFLDETGAEREQTLDGVWATSVQHQIDHLEGRLYIERLSRTKREMLLKRARKLAR